MSWYGTHPVVSKKLAKDLLPRGACKLCVYRMRVFYRNFINEAEEVVFFPRCPRCQTEISRRS